METLSANRAGKEQGIHDITDIRNGLFVRADIHSASNIIAFLRVSP